MSEPNYLAHARKDIGLKEVKGAAHSVRIGQWLKKLKAWWQDDETPWCGVAMGGWLSECGLPVPKEYYRASTWGGYGYPCEGPKLGAIAVMTRQGGGHVGIVTGVTADGGHVRVLGGNQGDMVKESFFEASRVTTYRAPSGYTLNAAPIVKIGELSRSEA